MVGLTRMQKKPFAELGLSPESLKAVAQVGYELASPIQAESIPALLAGKDVVGQSETGSGKTAAFALPAIEKVDVSIRAPQVIILCPTRELVMQVAEEVAKLAAFKRGVRELPIYGGASYERQFRGLKAGAQIIIGTPGRVIDHLERKTLSLEHVGFVVLDEADRMLDMGFRDDMETILSQAKPERQTVLFSATLPPAIQQMVKRFTKDPAHIRIQSKTLTVSAIEQFYYEVDRRSKVEVLCRILDIQDVKYALIFCATKIMVDELTEHLVARGYTADRLHGDMTQAMRERVMRRFRDKKVEILVATDVAARGLDVDDIEVVFNYDLPHDAEDYVHRIGRTGRAGRAGRAITFVAGREQWKLQQFMRVTKGRIDRKPVPSQSEVEQRQANRLFETLREVLEKGEYKRHDALIDELLEAGNNATDIISALLHLLAAENTRAGEQITEDLPQQPRREYPRQDDGPPRGGGGNYGRGGDFRGGGGGFREERGGFREERGGFRDDRGPRRDVRDERAPDRFAQRGGPPRREFREEPPVRSHEPGMVRLALNVGGEQMIGPGDVVGFIVNAANLPRESIGAIHVLPQRTLVDIAERDVETVLGLSGTRFKGRKVGIGPADAPAPPEFRAAPPVRRRSPARLDPE